MNSLISIASYVVTFGRPAAAYIDPATTSYLIQIVVGAVIAIGTFLGVYRNKIKKFFKKKSDNSEDTPNIERKSDNEKEVVTADDLLDDDK